MVFPDKFLWGVSSSGFQFEMGDPLNESLDPNTDWYVWVHDKQNIDKKIVSGDFPENGPNYWFLYKKDHEIASELGLNAYRIGIEWSRIFPKSTKDLKVDIERANDGKISKISAEESLMEKLEKIANMKALNHYRSIITDLRNRGFKVYLCLNHFTLPTWIHDPIIVRNSKLKKGPKGWFDEITIIEFWKFAAFLAYKLGDLIDYWITFNEPMVVTESGYLAIEAGFPPSLMNFNAFKKASVNMIIAHARAYDAIKEWDKIKAEEDSLPAEVGIIQNIIPVKPYDYDKKIDNEAAKFINHIHNLFFIEAISNGWLDENFNGIKEKEEIKDYLKNRLDWIGVNYYTRIVTKGRKSILAKLFVGLPLIPEFVNGYGINCKPNSFSNDNRPTSDFGWEIYPEGLSEALKLISKYEKPMVVTENGIADSEDKLRPKFILEHLKEIDKILNEEKLNVKGYFHWALIDNYEWAKGFSMRFGLYSVDFKSKEKDRIPRKRSTELFKKIIETGEIPEKINL
ncbi:MAG: beta-galactosidase BgaS [Nitrososphaerota archaeon]